MPESVVQCLNSQALAEGRKLNTSHMYVFYELLNSRKLIGPNTPSYFTPPVMQDGIDQPDPQPNPLFQPPVPVLIPPLAESILQGQLGGDSN